MSILFEGGCGLQVTKRNWRSASVNTSMAFKLTPSASQPTQSNTCCMLINITWLFSLWWEGPKLQFFRQIKVLLWYQKGDLIDKIHHKGRAWTKEKISESQQCQKLKLGCDWGSRSWLISFCQEEIQTNGKLSRRILDCLDTSSAMCSDSWQQCSSEIQEKVKISYQ